MLYGCGWEKVESDNFLFFCSSHLYRVQYSCSLGIAFFRPCYHHHRQFLFWGQNVF